MSGEEKLLPGKNYFEKENPSMKDLERALTNKEALTFDEFKYSFFILKPNAGKNYEMAIREIEVNQFIIVNQYAIMDFDTVNMALHMEQPASMKYIRPISRFNNDFYSNYAILVLVKKRDITYANFCTQVCWLKRHLRDKFSLPYVSYAFDTSELGEENKQEKLMIIAKSGETLKKDAMNNEGTFMVFSMNCIHTPDDKIEKTIKEIKLLKDMGLFEERNVIPKTILSNIKKYKTFEFLQDM